MGQLHDLLPGGVGQRSPIHKYPPELVDPAVTCMHTNQRVRNAEFMPKHFGKQAVKMVFILIPVTLRDAM